MHMRILFNEDILCRGYQVRSHTKELQWFLLLNKEKANKQRYLELLNDDPMRDSSANQSLVASF